ncbi:MAG: hypothetical protein Q8S42_29850 [Archangium sp.]|nr:hypothetical protein [Archangium sp.]
MITQRSWLFALGVCLSACVTTKDSVGGGDARLDEDQQKEDAVKVQGRACGPELPGDVVLLDSRTGGPVTCLPVTVTREPMSCPANTECQSEVLFKGFTSAKGQLKLIAPVEKSRLVAVADGFSPSSLNNATSVKDRVLELELMPAEGFWLKVLDGEGNYLADTTVTFKQGDDVIAQLRANTMANVFFTQRQPFAGQPVSVEAPGYKSLTISSPADLGEDGHTLTLQK